MNKVNLNQRWYIEMKGSVIGPRSSADIIRDLINGEMRVIWRVSRDKMNWKAVCNESHFEDAVKELIRSLTAEALKFSAEKANQNEAIDEKSGFYDLSNVTKNITEQLSHAAKLSELNVQLTSLRQLQADIMTNKKIVVTQQEQEIDVPHKDDQDEIILLRNKKSGFSFVSNLFALPSISVDFKAPQMKFGLMAVLVVIAVTVYMIMDKQRTVELAKHHIEEALREKSLGNFEKAISSFQSANNTKLADSNTLVQIAEAHMELKQNEQGAVLLEQALNKSSDPSERSKVTALLGLVALQKKDFSSAERHFEASLQDEESFLALHNLAIVHLFKNEPDIAENLLLRALQTPNTEPNADIGPTLMALFEASVMLDVGYKNANPRSVNQFSRVKKVVQLFDQMMGRYPQFQQEMIMARTIASGLMNDNSLLQANVQKFIDIDTATLPSKHLQFGMDYQRTTSNHLYGWCANFYAQDPSSALRNAFLATCVHRIKGPKDALPYAEYAFKMNSENPQVKAVLSNLLLQVGNPSKAIRVLSTPTIRPDSSRLYKTTVAQICVALPSTGLCNMDVRIGLGTGGKPGRLTNDSFSRRPASRRR